MKLDLNADGQYGAIGPIWSYAGATLPDLYLGPSHRATRSIWTLNVYPDRVLSIQFVVGQSEGQPYAKVLDWDGTVRRSRP